MRALTLIQPWATAIIHLGKDVENRGRGPWRTIEIGERIAIHAGAKFDKDDAWGLQREIGEEADELVRHPMHQRALIGTIEIACVVTVEPAISLVAGDIRGDHEAGCRALDSRWRSRQATTLIGLRNPRALATPIACKGALGLWRVPAEHVAALEAIDA